MTNEQINLIRASFAQIQPVAEEAGVLFYVRLFELDPSLRRLFDTDFRTQGIKLLQMIEFAVKRLDDFDEIVPAVRALGERHAAYGVEGRHYETMGLALLWTFEEALHENFTAETKEAWTAVYNFLAGTMKDAGRRRAENAADL